MERFSSHSVRWSGVGDRQVATIDSYGAGMSLILNLIWLVLAGFWMAVGYAIAGVMMLLTIVGIPLAVPAFRMAVFSLWPFGKAIVQKPGASGGSALANIVWIVFAGWWIALGHVATAVGFFVTIIGIPFGIASLKLAALSFVPYGKQVVPRSQADATAIFI